MIEFGIRVFWKILPFSALNISKSGIHGFISAGDISGDMEIFLDFQYSETAI